MEFTSKETITELTKEVLKVIYEFKLAGKINEDLASQLGKHVNRTFKYHNEENKLNSEIV